MVGIPEGFKLEDTGFMYNMYRDPVEYLVGQAITVGALPALKDLPLRRGSLHHGKLTLQKGATLDMELHYERP